MNSRLGVIGFLLIALFLAVDIAWQIDMFKTCMDDGYSETFCILRMKK